MRCIVLLAFLVAVCSAYPYQTGYSSGYGYGSGVDSIYSGNHYKINPNGSLTIQTSFGSKITVSKGIYHNNVVITVMDSTITGKKSPQYWYQKTQADFLAEILAKYEGEVSPSKYQELLKELHYGMQMGKVSFGVYQYLQKFNPIPTVYQPYSQQVMNQQMYPMEQGVSTVGPMSMWMRGKRGMNVVGMGGKPLMPYFMYNKVGSFGQPGPLPQFFEGERELLNHQDLFQEAQIMQQQQQQLQMQQQYMNQLQSQMLNEQEDVFEQQLQQQYTLGKMFNIGTPFKPMVHQTSFSQQYPNFYTRGLYGGYGQGMQPFYNIPMVPMAV